jgi:hypothetical protein
MLWRLGGICGYIVFGFICDIIGRRLTDHLRPHSLSGALKPDVAR